MLFANAQSPAYDSTKSLLCANCHGVDGGGGVGHVRGQERRTPRCDPKQTVDDELADDQPYCLPAAGGVGGAEPQLAPLRYSRAQLTQIITFGRPGTPMPAWGVASGKGVLNEQSIEDLVNYVESIATTPDKAQAQARRRTPTTTRDDARRPRGAGGGGQVGRRRDGRRSRRRADATAARRRRRAQTRSTARRVVRACRRASEVGRRWQRPRRRDRRRDPVHEQLRPLPHAGLVVLRPDRPEANPPPGPMGGGAYGPNLTDGDVDQQFPPPTGEAELLRLDLQSACRPTRRTASAASRRAACRTSARCSPRRRSKRSWPTSGVAVGAQTTCLLDPRRRAHPQEASGTRRSSACSSWSPAIVLFCGSIYLLLGTNLGARLGFLVAFTGLMGFMVILTRSGAPPRRR